MSPTVVAEEADGEAPPWLVGRGVEPAVEGPRVEDDHIAVSTPEGQHVTRRLQRAVTAVRRRIVGGKR
jgi:hypothetical protein